MNIRKNGFSVNYNNKIVSFDWVINLTRKAKVTVKSKISNKI